MSQFHHKEWLTTPLSIVIAGAFIAVGIYIGARELAPKSVSAVISKPTTAQIGTSIKPRPVGAQDHIYGNPDARAFVIEYSDTECPFCKRFHETMHELMAKYAKGGSVAWVYRHYPLDSIHSKARKEAEAVECAASLGGTAKFWQYLDLVYKTTPSNNKLDPAELPNIAEKVGLDRDKFEKCLASGKYAAKVEADFKDGIAAGAKGTPYSLIVTKEGVTPIKGAVEFATLEKMINDALNK